MAGAASLWIKKIEEIDEYVRVAEFQEEIWGNDAVTPVAQLIAAASHGGIVLGAYLNNELIGFCYGFSGYKNNENYLISHMTAVKDDFHNLGIGRSLKLQQREWALKYGYKKIVWTFDPLEVRNAYFNLNKLGAYTSTYIEAYYGNMNDKLNQGLPSDRFLIEWDIGSRRVHEALKGQWEVDRDAVQNYQNLMNWDLDGGLPYPVDAVRTAFGSGSGFLLPVPADFQSLKKQSFEHAKIWRSKTRDRLTEILSADYKVTGILIEPHTPVHFYIIENKTVELTK